MARRSINLVAAGIAVLAVALALWRLPTAPSVAPPVSLQTLSGERVALSSLRGRPVLVSFWATSCATCVREIPQLAALYRELGPRGLEIIGVAMPYDPPDRVLRMTRERAIPYPIALDVQGEATRAFGDVQVTPTHILVGPDGQIVRREVGGVDHHRLRARIERLLSG